VETGQPKEENFAAPTLDVIADQRFIAPSPQT
jgi:hypothetical protein